MNIFEVEIDGLVTDLQWRQQVLIVLLRGKLIVIAAVAGPFLPKRFI